MRSGQENEQEQSVALENSVTGRRKPASRRQGCRDRPGQGAKTASYHVRGRGIYSVGEDIFFTGVHNPFNHTHEFLYAFYFYMQKISHATYYIMWEVTQGCGANRRVTVTGGGGAGRGQIQREGGHPETDGEFLKTAQK